MAANDDENDVSAGLKPDIINYVVYSLRRVCSSGIVYNISVTLFPYPDLELEKYGTESSYLLAMWLDYLAHEKARPNGSLKTTTYESKNPRTDYWKNIFFFAKPDFIH